MSSEGNGEILFFVRAQVEGVFIQHHVNLNAVPFLLHADRFLEGRGVLDRACDFNRGSIERVYVQFRLLFIAVDFNPWRGWSLSAYRH